MPSGVPRSRDQAIRESHLTQGPADEQTGLEPGPAPGSEGELDWLRQQVAELARAQAHDQAETARLRRELEENQAIVARMMAESSSIDMAAIQAKWARREQARRRIYQHVAGKKVIIMLHRHQDPRRNHPVHLNCNGKFYDVIPGKPTEVEGEFLEVLDHASVSSFVSEVDEFGNPKMQVLDYFSYPYQVLHGLEGLSGSEQAAAAA